MTEPDGTTSAVRRRRPPGLLLAAATASAALGVVLLVGLAVGHWPFAFDRTIILALRTPGDPSIPIGPPWLLAMLVDITALGGTTVLTLVVVVVAGLLLAHRLWLTALLTVAATVSGSVAVQQVKLLVGRSRPAIADHLVDVGGLSFPSGHAANSAIVYLTVAALATQVMRRRLVRTYVVAVAILLVGAIGCSRVYLGVHWPSDVLAGWSFGTIWALGWWLAGVRSRAAAGGE